MGWGWNSVRKKFDTHTGSPRWPARDLTTSPIMNLWCSILTILNTYRIKIVSKGNSRKKRKWKRDGKEDLKAPEPKDKKTKIIRERLWLCQPWVVYILHTSPSVEMILQRYNANGNLWIFSIVCMFICNWMLSILNRQLSYYVLQPNQVTQIQL